MYGWPIKKSKVKDTINHTRICYLGTNCQNILPLCTFDPSLLEEEISPTLYDIYLSLQYVLQWHMSLTGLKSSHQILDTKSYSWNNCLVAYIEIAPSKYLKIRSTGLYMLSWTLLYLQLFPQLQVAQLSWGKDETDTLKYLGGHVLKRSVVRDYNSLCIAPPALRTSQPNTLEHTKSCLWCSQGIHISSSYLLDVLFL